MLVFLANRRTGDQHAADIGLDDTPDKVKESALQAFPNFVGVEVADLQLSVGGEVLCDDEPLSSVAAVGDGCTVDVDLLCQHHLDDLHSGRKQVWEVPLWVSDKADVIKSVRYHGQLRSAHITVRADRDIALAAVQQNGYTLEYVSSSLKDDREICRAAVQQSAYSLQYVDGSLQTDHELNLAAVQQNGCALKYVPCSLKADRELNLIAVQQHAAALRYVYPTLKADCEAHLLAMREDPTHGVNRQELVEAVVEAADTPPASKRQRT
eukprot:TRINITY_DN384_c0_g1_i2.p1 TRINITY_DN384_c0_g1~~TRINITY_DN384_c0_g1_i2.p1  ORF type:complete len:267 (+),score=46.72 TRINITY_DN384_c0_g1_i2:81-881(+)